MHGGLRTPQRQMEALDACSPNEAADAGNNMHSRCRQPATVLATVATKHVNQPAMITDYGGLRNRERTCQGANPLWWCTSRGQVRLAATG